MRGRKTIASAALSHRAKPRRKGFFLRLPVHGPLTDPLGQTEELALHQSRIGHLDPDLRGQVFPEPRRGDDDLGSDLPEVRFDRFRRFGEIHREPAGERDARAPDLIDDPGRRRNGKPVGADPDRRLDKPLARHGRKIAMGEHGEFWQPRRPRGLDHDGHVIGAPPPELRGKELRLFPFQLVAPFEKLPEARKPGVVAVRAHPRGVHVDDGFDEPQPRARLEQLVDLLLVLGNDHGGLEALQGLGQFVGDGGGEEVHRDTAHGLGAQFAEQPLGVIVRHDGDVFPAPHPEAEKTQRRAPDVAEIILPVVRLPDPVSLLADRRVPGPQTLCLFAQDLRQGVLAVGIQCRVIESCRPAVAAHALSDLRDRHRPPPDRPSSAVSSARSPR